MPAPPSTNPTPPPPELLADDLVELRLLRLLSQADAAARPVNERFLARVPEYRFAVHRRRDGLRVGRIHIRVTNDKEILHAIGHGGYAIDEAHRCQGYATRAVKLIVGLAEFWNVLPLWILVETDNTASRRTLERAGLVLIDVVDSSPEVAALGVGAKVCRYRSVAGGTDEA